MWRGCEREFGCDSGLDATIAPTSQGANEVAPRRFSEQERIESAGIQAIQSTAGTPEPNPNSGQVADLQKLHLFVDETGSVAEGGFFLVAILAVADDLAEVERLFLELEYRSDRRQLKWVRSSQKRKAKFLEGLQPILQRLHRAAWRTHASGGGNLVEMTVSAVVDSALLDPGCVFTVKVDGLNDVSLQLVRRAFRAQRLHLRKATGGRDESEPLLRLADALAGFLGDVHKGKPYAVASWESLGRFFTPI